MLHQLQLDVHNSFVIATPTQDCMTFRLNKNYKIQSLCYQATTWK